MPTLSLPTRLARRGTAVALGAAAVLAGVSALPATALASRSQVSMIEDFNDMTNPQGTLQQFRELGANTVRVLVNWDQVAPSPNATKKPNFNATDPSAYSAAGWAPYDNIVSWAQKYGLTVDLTVTGGAPRWAEAAAAPPAPGVNPQTVAWRPNATDYGQFVQAVAKRYPSVHFWSLFNEPNFGQDLGPQATNGSRTPVAPMMYRGLVNAGYKALQATGHGRNTILIGELAAEGSEPHTPTHLWPQGLPGNYAQTRALLFIRDLYCVNSSYQELRGSAARALGCPTTTAASRKFRSQNPGLFTATGFADHPYDGGASPTSRAGLQADFATFPVIGNLEATLDHVNKVYGSSKHYPIYDTEYGEITSPPAPKKYPSPGLAATYLNEAEYISYKNGRMASYMQYLLKDPPANVGLYNGFASGLEYSNGKPKPTYAAYQVPVWMPVTSFSHTSSEEVWGSARPAPFMKADSKANQYIDIQVDNKTVKVQRVNDGYFDVHLKFAKGRHSVRATYTFPKTDPFLPVSELGKTIDSRSFTINVK